MLKAFKIDIRNPVDRNAWYLVLEIFWATFLGAATTFNTAFAIRLGATDGQIGLLSSLPALLALIVLIPAGRFLNRTHNQRAWLLGSLTVYRTGFLVMALIPWLKFAGINQGALMVFWLVFLSIPMHFFNVGFLPLLTEVIPPANRANVFTARNVVYNAALSVCVYFYGQWLSKIQFPVNYQLMYVISYVIALLSLFFLLKIQMPQKPRLVIAEQARRSFLESLRQVRQDFTDHPNYSHMVRNTLFHSLGMWMVMPLYMLYFVNELHATDSWIGIQGSIASLATIAGFLVWRSWMMKLGELRTLRYTIVLAGVFPILVGFSHSLTPILIWVGINGLIAGGISLSHMNTLLRVMPEKDRPGYTAIYMTIMNVGVFITPLLGVWLANKFGYGPVLIACGALSILGSFSFWVWPIHSEE